MTESAQELVRRQPVPRDLAALGVKVAQDAESGMQLVVIPPEVARAANVLMPVQAFQQADPNWTPSLRAVQLNGSKDGPHFYQQAGGKLAPRKQALELLADAAGVVSVRTQLLNREAFEVGGVRSETFDHHAVLQIRKSDGTLRTVEATRTYEPVAEYEEIRDAVLTASNKRWTDDEREIRKRWLNEIKFAKAKNESKAILRAIRSAIQIPHTYTQQEAQKPFIVVGWNFTPPDDPETRAAIASAVARLYGGSDEPARPALEAGPSAWPEGEEHVLPPFTGPESAQEDAEGSEPVRAPAEAPEPAQAPTEAPEPEPGAEEEPEPGAEEVEVIGEVVPDDPEFAPEKTPEIELADEAGKMVPARGIFARGGKVGEKTLAEILDYGDDTDPERGRSWLSWARRNWKDKNEPFYLGLVAFLTVYAPDLLES